MELHWKRACFLQEISLRVQPLPHVKGIPIAKQMSGLMSHVVQVKVERLGYCHRWSSVSPMQESKFSLNVREGLTWLVLKQAGITNFIVQGKVRVILKPLLPQTPIVGAMQVRPGGHLT